MKPCVLLQKEGLQIKAIFAESSQQHGAHYGALQHPGVQHLEDEKQIDLIKKSMATLTAIGLQWKVAAGNLSF